MNTQKTVNNKISKIALKNQKVDLSLIDDFEKIFKKAIDEDSQISISLIDALSKAENKYKAVINEYQKAIKEGEKAEDAAKQLGVDLPVTFKNKILSSKEGVKEAQKLIGKINQLYSAF